jgi:spermidine/putrescine-binding protein
MGLKRSALFLAAVMGLGASLVTGTASAQTPGKSITVLSWGVTWQSALQAVSEEYTKKTGVKVNLVTQSTSGEGLVKLQAMKSAPTIDVWLTTSSVADRAITDTSLFAELPKADMPSLKELTPGIATPRYVGLYSYPLSIVYRTDMVKTPPTSWKDLWDPRFKGKLGVPVMSSYQGRMLMIAAEVGGKPGDADTGFAELKKLKPNVVMFYTSDANARQSLAQGEVSVLVAPPSRAKQVADAGIPVKVISPKGTPMNMDVATLVNTPNKAIAADYLNFLLSKDINGEIAAKLSMDPVNAGSPKPPALLEALPKKGDGVVLDEKMINDHIDAWNQRFNTEIAQ